MTAPKGRQLMWTAEPVALAHPRVLFSSASAADVGAWRVANPWADNIPLVLFQGDGDGDVKELGAPFQDPGIVPWRVLGLRDFPKRPLLEAWYRASNIAGPSFAEQLARYKMAIRQASRLAIGDPAWTIIAGADDGVMAVQIAATRGRHVAIAGAPPGVLAVNLAVELGVSILVAQQSDQHRKNIVADLERLKWH